MQPVVKKSPALAVGGLILSGVLMVTGSLLTWYELEYSGLSLTVKGTDISMGNGVLRIGVLVTLIAVILLNRASKTGGRGWSIAAFILAVVVLPPSTFAAFEPEAIAPVAASEKVSKEFRVSPSVVEAALERVSPAPGVSVSDSLPRHGELAERTWSRSAPRSLPVPSSRRRTGIEPAGELSPAHRF